MQSICLFIAKIVLSVFLTGVLPACTSLIHNQIRNDARPFAEFKDAPPNALGDRVHTGVYLGEITHWNQPYRRYVFSNVLAGQRCGRPRGQLIIDVPVDLDANLRARLREGSIDIENPLAEAELSSVESYLQLDELPKHEHHLRLRLEGDDVRLYFRTQTEGENPKWVDVPIRDRLAWVRRNRIKWTLKHLNYLWSVPTDVVLFPVYVYIWKKMRVSPRIIESCLLNP